MKKHLHIDIDVDTLTRRFGAGAATEVSNILRDVENRVYFFANEGKRPLLDSTGEVVGHGWVYNEENTDG
jgi:hypothetical protein